VIKVPSCRCVRQAREISVLPIADRAQVDGYGTGSSSAGPALGFLLIRCDYCKSALKTEEAFDFSQAMLIEWEP